MPYFDWSVKDSIRQAKLLYRARGYTIESCTQHLIAVSFGTLALNATSSPAPVVISGQWDFLWLGNMMSPYPLYNANGPAGFATLIRFELLRSGRNLGRHRDLAGNANRGWIPPMSIAGTAEVPFVWPWPILLTQGDGVQLEAVHRGTTSLSNFRFTLLGIKIVREGRAAA